MNRKEEHDFREAAWGDYKVLTEHEGPNLRGTFFFLLDRIYIAIPCPYAGDKADSRKMPIRNLPRQGISQLIKGAANQQGETERFLGIVPESALAFQLIRDAGLVPGLRENGRRNVISYIDSQSMIRKFYGREPN